MKSFTQLRTDYGVDTKNTSSANLTTGDGWMNDFQRKLLARGDFPFMHRLRTATTQASTTFVPMPYDVDLVESVFVTVGSTRYNPKPAPNRNFWDKLHYSTITSDTPEYWFPYNGQIGLWPRPATAGNIISINCKIRVIDMTIADITSSTITTATIGSTNMVLSGGLGTNMAGFWIRPTFGTVSNVGDGLWYEISSVTSGTQTTLVRTYGGLTITSGTAASTIAQMSLLPEAFQDLPEVYASWRYWAKEKDVERTALYKDLLISGVQEFATTYSVGDLSMVIDDGEDRSLLNPNLTITL